MHIINIIYIFVQKNIKTKMKNNIYIRLFFIFLKKNNAYSEYTRLITKSKNDAYYEGVKSFLENAYPEQFIFGAFSWPSVDWAHLHRDWKKLINQFNICHKCKIRL